VDDTGAAHPQSGAVAQEFLEDLFGVRHGQSMKVELQLDVQVSALEIGEQPFLNAWTGEFQILMAFHLGFGHNGPIAPLAQMSRLVNRVRGRAALEGFGKIGVQGFGIRNRVPEEKGFRFV